MRRECRERFPPVPPRISDPDMNHGACVTHVSWCVPGSLTSRFLWSRWRGKLSRHSRCMCNPQFYVSVKRLMVNSLCLNNVISWSSRLQTSTYSSMAGAHVWQSSSGLFTLDFLKRINIGLKEISTHWLSNMHRSETIICLKLLNRWPVMCLWHTHNSNGQSFLVCW